MKRRPGSDSSRFCLPYVGMYAAECSIVPAVADRRQKLHSAAILPSAFPGLPAELMPATQVGISLDFSTTTHADSCIKGVTESIMWANTGIRGARFAITSIRTAFDIGQQPCMLFLKGNEMHGTVPGTKGIGLVLISKRNSLYHYRPGSYTDRVIIA